MKQSLAHQTPLRIAGAALLALTASLFAAAGAAQAATITVSNGRDSGAGSLRQAIASAANNDTIKFSQSVREVVLTSGQLEISKGVTIAGPGARGLTVKRSSAVNTRVFRVFGIQPGINNKVAIYGITVANGKITPGAGGGIAFFGDNGAQLNLVRIAVTGNDGEFGGGLDLSNDNGGTPHVVIDSSTITGNTTNGGMDCGFCNGAGMLIEVPTVITNSTISGNTAVDSGGGIKVDSDVTILNSTIAGNIAGRAGGGIWVTPYSNDPDLMIKNTLVADNTAGNGWHQCDLEGETVALSVNVNNLIEDGSCNSLWGGGWSTGQPTNFLSGDPGLSPLAYNGGETQTQALALSSKARGAGDAATCANVPVSGRDQTGAIRPRPCSIGAVDGLPPLAAPKVSWSLSKKSKSVTGLLTPVATASYAISAKQESAIKQGKCSAKKVKGKSLQSCKITLSPGRWTVSITPNRGGRAGGVTSASFKF